MQNLHSILFTFLLCLAGCLTAQSAKILDPNAIYGENNLTVSIDKKLNEKPINYTPILLRDRENYVYTAGTYQDLSEIKSFANKRTLIDAYFPPKSANGTNHFSPARKCRGRKKRTIFTRKFIESFSPKHRAKSENLPPTTN